MHYKYFYIVLQSTEKVFNDALWVAILMDNYINIRDWH